jgi:LmbE family N-acetylglucosaminyl deacetylase
LAAGSSVDAAGVILVVAHPDDEVIGAGGQLARLLGAGVLYVTDGAPRAVGHALAAGYPTREAYAQARRREAEEALALAGIPPERIYGLAIADQQASTVLAELTRRLARFFLEHPVHVVFTHAYEGGHPDHDATAFAVHGACALIARGGGHALEILEMAGYHAGSHGLSTHAFLPNDGEPLTIELDAAQRNLKRRMLACHVSQSRMLSHFGVEVERFRPAPRYDFAAPPHAGGLWYEQFNWGITGALWRRLASEAGRALGLNPRCSFAS